MLENGVKTDPRVQRTRQLLSQAMIDLLMERHDFQRITVQEIAEQAKVNRATFYAHFDDKYALLNYTIREMFRESLDKNLPATAAYSIANLRTLTLTVCEFAGSFLGHCSPTTQQDYGPIMMMQVQQNLHEILRTWLGNFAPSKNSHLPTPDVAAMAASWTIFGSALQWVSAGKKVAVEHLADQVVMLVVSGLQPLMD